MNFRKTALAAALCGAMLPGIAGAINIDGVTFNAGAVFSTVTLWEGDAVTGLPITAAGQTLAVYGRINQITDSGSSTVTWNSSATHELTFVATGFVSLAPAGPVIDFTGGSVTLYSDHTPDSVVGGPGGTTGFTDGNVWLTLSPQTLFGTGSVTLHSEVGSLVTGFGVLDVTGGLAAGNFDTNFYNAASLVANHGPGLIGALGPGDDGDIFFQSLGSLTGQNGWAFNGSGNIYAQAIPEPGTLALLGLGLAGIAGLVRRRK